jgi:hypothetical protein
MLRSILHSALFLAAFLLTIRFIASAIEQHTVSTLSLESSGQQASFQEQTYSYPSLYDLAAGVGYPGFESTAGLCANN